MIVIWLKSDWYHRVFSHNYGLKPWFKLPRTTPSALCISFRAILSTWANISHSGQPLHRIQSHQSDLALVHSTVLRRHLPTTAHDVSAFLVVSYMCFFLLQPIGCKIVLVISSRYHDVSPILDLIGRQRD